MPVSSSFVKEREVMCSEQKKLDNAKSLADFLSVSIAFVRKKSRHPEFPKLRLGRAIRFDRSAVLEFLTSNAHSK